MKKINLKNAFSSIWKVFTAYFVFHISVNGIILCLRRFDGFILFTQYEIFESPFILLFLSLIPFALSFITWRFLRTRFDKNPLRPLKQDILRMAEIVFFALATTCFFPSFAFNAEFFVFVACFYMLPGLLFMHLERKMRKEARNGQ